MLRFVFACLLVLPFFAASSLAQTELPSLATAGATDARPGDSARREAPPPVLARWREGSLDVPFGSLDYRFVRRGVHADLRIAGAAAAVLIGYRGGEPRLELAEWRAWRGDVRLALTARDGEGGYRLEFAREF